MNYDKIISEQIQKYINENIFDEASKKHKHHGHHDDIQAKIKAREGENVSKSDEERLRSLLQTDLFNIAAVAKRIYPDHTDEGAQSQLRKKILGEKSDSGSEYHLKQHELEAISNIINDIVHAL